MRSLLFILTILLCASNMNAQIICSAKLGEKWGFIDQKGNWFIQPRFEGVATFYNSFCVIYKNDFHGLINLKGEIVIPPNYNYVGDVSDGMVEVEAKNEKAGYYNTVTRTMIKPKFVVTHDFVGGYGVVFADEALYGVIDKTGKYVIAPKYKESDDEFCEGLLAVKNDDDKWGFVDAKGTLIIPHKFDQFLGAFKHDTAIVGIGIGVRKFHINKKGETIAEIPFDTGKRKFGWIRVKINDREKVGMTKYNDTIMKPIYETFGSPQKGRFYFELERKYGLADTSGKIIVPAKFDYLSSFTNDLAFASLNGRYGFIDRDGNTIIDFKYEDAHVFRFGMAAVKYQGKWGFIDAKGNWMIQPQFDDLDNGFTEATADIVGWYTFDGD